MAASAARNTMPHNLPPFPPAGKKRYKAICRDPKANPFSSIGAGPKTQTVDVDEATPFSQVEEWARQSAEKAGLVFVELEVVK
jgi:hypothetical protein